MWKTQNTVCEAVTLPISSSPTAGKTLVAEIIKKV
jgi:hypothetical protein